MTISIHINFNGQCQKAFEFYSQVLDGEIGSMLKFGDSPAGQQAAKEWQDKIVHANIIIQDIEIAGGDVTPEQYLAPQGFHLLLSVENEEEAQTIFNALSKDGHIVLPLQETFWSSCYGILVDRFGVPWKINCRQ